MPLWLEVVLRVVLVVRRVSSRCPLIVGADRAQGGWRTCRAGFGPMYAGGFHGLGPAHRGRREVRAEGGNHRAPATPTGRCSAWRRSFALVAVPHRAAGHPARSARPWSGSRWDVGLFPGPGPVLGIGVVAVLMSGWASANKYSLLGGLRRGGPSYSATSCRSCSRRPAWAMAASTLSLSGQSSRAWRPWVAHLATAGGDSSSSRPGWAEIRRPPVRHADRRLRAGLRLHDRVHRPALRVLPAR